MRPGDQQAAEAAPVMVVAGAYQGAVQAGSLVRGDAREGLGQVRRLVSVRGTIMIGGQRMGAALLE